jgi:hypothetical protein
MYPKTEIDLVLWGRASMAETLRDAGDAYDGQH